MGREGRRALLKISLTKVGVAHYRDIQVVVVVGGGSNMLQNHEFKHAIAWLFLSENANLCITSFQFSQISGGAYPSYFLYKATFNR